MKEEDARITDSLITCDVFSSGVAQLLTLHAQTGEAKTSGGSRDSSGPLINYERYHSAHTPAHSPTQQLSFLCALRYGKCARTTPWSLSCRSVRVEWRLQRPFITAQGLCHELWHSGLDGNWWARRVQGEVSGGFMGLNERIINLSQSATPVSKQRHWSRNIGLHPPATTLHSPLSCLALTFPPMQAKEGIKTGWKRLTFSFILLLGHPFPLLSLWQNCWCRFMAKRESERSCRGSFKPTLIQIKLAWYGSVERFQGQCVYSRPVSVRCSTIDSVREDWTISFSWIAFPH